MVFHEDKDAVNDIQERRQAMEKLKGEEDDNMYNTNLSAIVLEIKALKK